MRTLDCQRPSARAALLRPVGRGRGEGEPCSPRAPGAKAPFAFGDSARKATRRGRHGIDGTRPPGRDGARRGGHGGGCPGVRAARGMTAWDATCAAWTTRRRGHQSLRISGGRLLPRECGRGAEIAGLLGRQTPAPAVQVAGNGRLAALQYVRQGCAGGPAVVFCALTAFPLVFLAPDADCSLASDRGVPVQAPVLLLPSRLGNRELGVFVRSSVLLTGSWTWMAYILAWEQ